MKTQLVELKLDSCVHLDQKNKARAKKLRLKDRADPFLSWDDRLKAISY